ncbi:MAG TPA: hypothetical protein VGE27_18570 [Gemmatimonas sp.]|uniref:TolB family protein n=1 Tax=Gemmatimonas sp. TaxID=1962908 RepID=UPI002ED7D09E
MTGVALAIALTGCRTHWSESTLAPAPAGQIERLVAPGILTRDHEFIVAFSHDARSAVLSRRTFIGSRWDRRIQLVHATRDKGPWNLPRPFPWADTAALEIDPVVVPRSGDLLFNSTRSHADRASGRTDFDIWLAPRTSGGWGAPQRLGAPINGPDDDYFATVSCSGTMYFARAVSGPPRRSAILRAHPLGDGRYSEPETLSVVNTTGRASNAAIAADESLVILVDERREGRGDSDLYVSRRNGASWTEPVPLRVVNSAEAEFAPAFSPDGEWLFFARMRRGTTGGRPITSENVYAIRLREALPLGMAMPGKSPAHCQ